MIEIVTEILFGPANVICAEPTTAGMVLMGMSSLTSSAVQSEQREDIAEERRKQRKKARQQRKKELKKQKRQEQRRRQEMANEQEGLAQKAKRTGRSLLTGGSRTGQIKEGQLG